MSSGKLPCTRVNDVSVSSRVSSGLSERHAVSRSAGLPSLPLHPLGLNVLLDGLGKGERNAVSPSSRLLPAPLFHRALKGGLGTHSCSSACRPRSPRSLTLPFLPSLSIPNPLRTLGTPSRPVTVMDMASGVTPRVSHSARRAFEPALFPDSSLGSTSVWIPLPSSLPAAVASLKVKDRIAPQFLAPGTSDVRTHPVSVSPIHHLSFSSKHPLTRLILISSLLHQRL